MAQQTVFYSWQSDLPNATNRAFIQQALEDAARAIRADASIAIEPVIDRDTANVAESPDISSTIFAKIDRADVFVCDVSIVNKDASDAVAGRIKRKTAADGIRFRPTPNPNVLVELGYASRGLGWSRIVMVMNEAYGDVPLLPFDLRQKRVVRYAAPWCPGESGGRAPEWRRLAGQLEAALRTVFADHAPSPTGTDAGPPTAGEQAIDAVEAARPDRRGRIKRYMAWLAGEIDARAPEFGREPDRGVRDDLLIRAIERSTGMVAEFARLAHAVATVDSADHAADVARALYEGFAGIIALYNHRPGVPIGQYDADFDLARFLGHELFVIFFFHLLADKRRELIDGLLRDEFHVTNAYGFKPGMVSFPYIARPVELLNVRNARLHLRRMSLHADLLNERHAQGDLGYEQGTCKNRLRHEVASVAVRRKDLTQGTALGALPGQAT